VESKQRGVRGKLPPFGKVEAKQRGVRAYEVVRTSPI
tara:strand:- start:1112 stop:1222 length:111 start_codon:yes stop_codon:yes gene_type:complete